ncbi:MAG TPA: hypothetical protein VFQ61_23360, partial [Polyangiaceae bacterium]|nr:hypothetical protein [Polyangiaceae bacterium]
MRAPKGLRSQRLVLGQGLIWALGLLVHCSVDRKHVFGDISSSRGSSGEAGAPPEGEPGGTTSSGGSAGWGGSSESTGGDLNEGGAKPDDTMLSGGQNSGGRESVGGTTTSDEDSTGGGVQSGGASGAAGADGEGGSSSGGAPAQGGMTTTAPAHLTVVKLWAAGSGACALMNDDSFICKPEIPQLAGLNPLEIAVPCVVLRDQTARCWGANDVGQVGDGTNVPATNPVPVSGLGNVSQIVSGSYHRCALLNDGSVKCWGEGEFGQLGNGKLYIQSS